MIDPPAAPPIGVLLVNLGSPDAAEPAAVRRYLREFLSDPRVIEDQGLFARLLSFMHEHGHVVARSEAT